MYSSKHIQTWFFFALLLIVSLLCFLVFKPFISTLLVALIFSIVLEPLQERLVKMFGGRRTLSAFVLTVLVMLSTATVLTFLVANIFQESRDAYVRVLTDGDGYLEMLTGAVEAPVQMVFPGFDLDLKQAAGNLFAFIGEHAGGLLSGGAHLILAFFLGIVSLFFFLKDGLLMKRAIIAWSPLENHYDTEILNRLEVTINSVIRGSLLVAIIQGTLVGLGFFTFGVPEAFLWGSVAAIAALIPGIGTALVVTPAVLYLFFSGNTGAAVGLLLWGALLVGTIDNLLAPYLYGRGSKVHPLFMLFSVLGGISAFGAAGFIFGPILLTLLVALTDIYKLIVKSGTQS